MKKLILTTAVLIFMAGCKDNKPVTGDTALFKSDDFRVQVDKMPEVKGGMTALLENLIYPAEAKEQNIEGKVIVKVFLDEKGEVANTEILKSDNKLLEQSAIDAIEKTKFTPGMAKGENVKTQIVIPIVFKLDGQGSSDNKENKYPKYLQEVDEYPVPVGGFQVLAQNIVYPKNEKEKGVQGQVIVRALISESGEVIKTEVVKGVNAALDKAALDAINKTKFTPAKKDGKEVKAQVQIPITFKLQ